MIRRISFVSIAYQKIDTTNEHSMIYEIHAYIYIDGHIKRNTLSCSNHSSTLSSHLAKLTEAIAMSTIHHHYHISFSLNVRFLTQVALVCLVRVKIRRYYQYSVNFSKITSYVFCFLSKKNIDILPKFSAMMRK
jgi:hypothetical protein